MEFAIYSRKSKQTGKGASIQYQIDCCKEYIVNHFGEQNNIHIFEEKGISAKNTERMQFQNMMLLAQQKKLDYIVCYRLDRISRNVGDFAVLIQQLSLWDTAFISVQEQFDTSTPSGRAMMYMASVFAQLERETIAERVRDNLFYLAKKGYWLGGTFPLGFTSQRVVQNKHSYCYLVEKPFEMNIVKNIYTLFWQYGTLSEVKRQLKKQNICTRKGNEFSLTAIKEILANPVYCKADSEVIEYFLEKGTEVTFTEKQCSDDCGLMVYNKRNYTKKSSPRQDMQYWIVALAKHKGVVSGEKWVNIQHILHKNSRQYTQHKTENKYALFSGVLYCGICGEKMQSKKRRNHQKTMTFDYICRGKLQGKYCTIQNLLGKQTDDSIEEMLLKYIEQNDHFYEIWKKWKEQYQHKKCYEKDIAYCQKQKQNYIDLLGNKHISDEVIKEINNKIEELSKQQKLFQYKKMLYEKEQYYLKQYQCSTFRMLWQKMSIVQKQQAIQYLIEKAIWNGKEIKIVLKQ